ncbi:MAG TPA: OmpW family outer membrane protein [Ignavibacteria bacterium]|nr:OmpW family outer membrane protein [Ignavibacteria bacterium]HMQ99403.1 OmpW family outer membrane protein [Ignavibacteria bacterium]
MRKLGVLLCAFLLLSASAIYTQPKLTLHLTGGYGVPLGDFKTDLPPTSPVTEDNRADADYFPYFTKQLLNFGVDGKLAFGKQGNARVTMGLTYNMFSNNADAIFRINPNNDLAVTTFKPKVNVLSISLGGEWAFAPKKKVNPFLGAGVAANFFSGEFEFGREVRIKGAQRTGPMDMKSETRIGIIFDGGIDFHLSPQVGAIIGVKYHMINPLGKGADDPSEVGANEIDLGDQEHTEDGKTFPNRTISSINGYVGVSFYFGAPKTVKK